MILQEIVREQEVYVPETFGNQAFSNQTTLHPVGLLAAISLGVMLLLVPRKKALLPLFLMACFVSPAQRLVVASLDFDMLRILVLFAGARILARGEYRGLRWNPLDICVVSWCFVSSVAYVLQVGTFGAVINRLGGAYDTLGMYFMVRCLLRDLDGYDRCMTYLLWIAMPVFLAFLVERMTQRNPFSFLGGVPAITRIREGRLRCTGPFAHPILAGCFWSAALALVLAQWWRQPKRPFLYVTGVLCMLGIIAFTASSTPLLGAGVAVLGWMGWLTRNWTRPIRWATLLGLIGLHMIMNKPVWHLLARMSVVGGSTGWHRYALIDRAIANFGEWWLIGTRSTAHWGRQMFDLTNQFVKEGVQGGFLALVLFLAMFTFAFGGAGRMRKRYREGSYAGKAAWGLGVGLLTHGAMFFAISISYSQQNLVVWFFTLGAIGSLAPWKQRAPAPARRRQLVPLRVSAA